MILLINLLLNILKKFYNLILFFFFIIIFYYIFKNYFINLCFCENINSLVKDFHSCDCYKNLKHGEFIQMPDIYDPDKISILMKIFFKTYPYVNIFYDMFSPFECDCHCKYCLTHKLIYSGLFILAMLLILSNTGSGSGSGSDSNSNPFIN